MSTGVTDFIVASPAGHTRAGPAGSFKAGDPGVVKISQAGSVPVSPAGHVPIDTGPARIPYGATGGGTMVGGVGGGGAGGGSGGGGGGGSTSGHSNPTSSMMVSMALNSPATGGDNHFTPGGHVPVDTGTGGHFIPGGNVPISTNNKGIFLPGGSVTPSPGFHHFTPSGSVPITPGFSHFVPGGMVPTTTGGSGHFVPGGHVPVAPKLGIDPNMPPARVNPPRAGSVQPSRMTNWHGPQDMHTQSWPRDQYEHVVSTKAWEPSDTKSTWEPPDAFAGFLTTDFVDAGKFMEMSKVGPLADITQAGVKNQFFDFSVNNDIDSSVNTSMSSSMALQYNANSQSSFEPHNDRTFISQSNISSDNSAVNIQVDNSVEVNLNNNSSYTSGVNSQTTIDAGGDRNVTVDMSDRGPVKNDFSETDYHMAFNDNSSVLNVENVYNSNRSSVVNYVEERALVIDDSRSVHNDFSQFMDIESHFDTTVIDNSSVVYADQSRTDFHFDQSRSSVLDGSMERGAGGVLFAKG